MSDFKGKKTVEIRIYIGAEAYDAKGNLISETTNFTLTYNDTMWKKNLNNLRYLNVKKIEVIAYYEGEEQKSIPTEITAEVQEILAAAQETLTPDQLKMQKLEADNLALAEKLESFMKQGAGSAKKKPAKEPAATAEELAIKEDLKKAREEYEEVFKKKGLATWDAVELRKIIESEKAKTK